MTKRGPNNVFRQFDNAYLEDIHPTEDQNEVHQALSLYLELVIDRKPLRGKGITLIGPPGLGKTMLACALINGCYEVGQTTDCLSMTSFVSLFHTKFDYSKRLDSQGREPDPVLYEGWREVDTRLRRILETTDFVLFDDVGKEYDSGNGWSGSQWDSYLRHRYSRGLPTFITSNTPVDAWADRYSDSMGSFIHEATMVYEMHGEDLRTP